MSCASVGWSPGCNSAGSRPSSHATIARRASAWATRRLSQCRPISASRFRRNRSPGLRVSFVDALYSTYQGWAHAQRREHEHRFLTFPVALRRGMILAADHSGRRARRPVVRARGEQGEQAADDAGRQEARGGARLSDMARDEPNQDCLSGGLESMLAAIYVQQLRGHFCRVHQTLRVTPGDGGWVDGPCVDSSGAANLMWPIADV